MEAEVLAEVGILFLTGALLVSALVMVVVLVVNRRR